MFEKFEELKKQFLYYAEYFQNYIFESNAFNLLKEKYQSYSLTRQKLIKYGLISLILFLISFLPLYYFYVSSRYWTEFEQKRELSLNLLKVRNYKSMIIDENEYKIRDFINQTIKKYKEKDFSIKDKPAKSKHKKIKKTIYTIQVDHLNIRQAIQMGTDFNNIFSARLISLTMKESKYLKHYDVVFELEAYFYKMKKSHLKPKRNFKPKSRGAKKGAADFRKKRMKNSKINKEKKRNTKFKNNNAKGLNRDSKDTKNSNWPPASSDAESLNKKSNNTKNLNWAPKPKDTKSLNWAPKLKDTKNKNSKQAQPINLQPQPMQLKRSGKVLNFNLDKTSKIKKESTFIKTKDEENKSSE